MVARRAASVLGFALLAAAGPAGGSDRQVLACKVADAAGGSNSLEITLQGDRLIAFGYRRSDGLPRCEIAASRAPSAYDWERFEWIDAGDVTEVRVFSDASEDAHVRIRRDAGRYVLQVLSYDRDWLCGLGQHLNPVIVLSVGDGACCLLSPSGVADQ